MLINTVTPHASKIIKPIIFKLLRCWDRGCSFGLEAPDGSVRTKKLLQGEFEAMYTGQEIESYHLYAQVFTSLLVTMTFAGGLPMLYPIAFLNFLVLYWVYKVLLVKYYQKTVAFDQGLPIYTVRYFKFAIFFHVLASTFMYTNHVMVSSERLSEVATPVTDVVSEWSSHHAELGGAVTVGLAARFSKTIGIVYLLFIILLIVLAIFQATVVSCLSACFEKMCGMS
jgi:hypothetical protein